MITHVRWGQWETNSSSIHQLVIRTTEPELTDKPEGGLVIRCAEFNIDSELISGTQRKLDVIVGCLLQSMNYGQTDGVIPALFKLMDIIQAEGVEVTWDTSSFDKDFWLNLSDDLVDDVIKLINEEPKKVASILFDPRSRFGGDHNGYRYEGSDRLFYEEDPEYKDFEVFTEEY